ncbi:MAG: hypothetical protein J5600_03300 [Desulfovibrio sp.]|jgi:hypothetical protein|nr:hypothetical protein [Desulfovibrio sp.]MBO4684339.1 hypothetical protein [Desulfovibrio sp.]MBR5051155.1 hypothetical protein [Desulfovibrio sp.]MBR6467214.1 hypothetical protein [Desulfovibrio sp.]
MDKDQKEALQVAKELTAKLIECRTVSAANIGDVFPSIYRIVLNTILESAPAEPKAKGKGGDK